MKKLNNYHHKTSSDYISKHKPKNQMTSSAVIFKSNVMNIKINNISNSKDGYIFIPNSKVSNGRSFDKELQENKKIIKNYLKNEKMKKESEKDSIEIESKEELSTNNLTETLQYNNDTNLNIKNHGLNSSNNYNNYINNNISKKLSTINNRNNTKSNYIPTISINIKKNVNENRIKANIDAKTKSKKKKCLYMNNSNIIKKNNNSNNNLSSSNTNGHDSNDIFNKVTAKESFDNKIFKKNMENNKDIENKKVNFQNKDMQKTKRKLATLTEDNLNKALLPSKCKTQNYLHNNMNQNSNYISNRKIVVNNNILSDNKQDYENNYIKNLINSKKKLFIKNKDINNKNNKGKKEMNENKKNKEKNENKDNKDIKKNIEIDSKETSYKKNKTKNVVNNIKLKQKNVLLLKSISVTQKLVRTKSPENKNTMTLNNTKYFDNINTITQDLIDKDFYTVKNNTERGKEDNKNINGSNKNLISNIKKTNSNNKQSNKTQKDKKVSKTSQKYTLIKKNKPKNIENKKLNENIIFTKKKKISQNNVNNNSGNKNVKLDNSFDDNMLTKNPKTDKNNKHIAFHNTTPFINKVLIFEVENNKILNNINNNINNSKNCFNLNKINNSNNHSYKNIIHLESKNNKNINNNSETTPKKNILTDIIRKNIEYNKEKKNFELTENKNSMGSYVNESYFGENNSTPIDHKHAFNRNKKYFENKESEERRLTKNNTNKLSNYKNDTNFKNNKEIDEDKNINDMDTPPNILNTPKLTRRITDDKINLFEKVKSINNENDIFKNIKNNKNFNNRYEDDNSNETDEIIYEETSIPLNKRISYNNYKIKFPDKIESNNLIENNIVNLLFLEEECLDKIFDFCDISMVNTFSLLNKKYYNCFKKIIHKKIKNKILKFYEKNFKYNNKIKLSLMELSPLSKISPLLLHKKYIDLLFEKDNKYDKDIKKDLTRTFPNNSTFKYGNTNYNKLYHLLTVYSLYNQKIGYAQGINFLVAHIIILFEKEEDAFVFLDGLLQKFEFEKLLGLQNELDNKLKNISFYIKNYCQEIYNYFDSMKLSHEFFTTNWMITLFSNSMDNKYLFIVWDFLIIFGWKFFKYFIVSILNIYKDNILEEEQNTLTFFMKNIFRNDTFTKKFKDILNKTFEFMNKDNDLN